VCKNVLNDLKIEAFVFVDKYNFSKDREEEMMAQALADIDISDMLIAEVSDKAIGIGVEVGYAKAKKKPVVYLRNINAEHSTTISGVSDYGVFYKDENDLKNLLYDVLNKIEK
jgi:nucleoside 2-deoxyribosyltransferase